MAICGAFAVVAAQDSVRVFPDSVSIELLYDELPATAHRLEFHKQRGVFFIMHRTGDFAVFDPSDNSYQPVAVGSELDISEPSGFGISPQGDLFVVGNDRMEPWVTGTLKRASLPDGSNTPGPWTVVAETVPYELAENFNHLMSALAVGPDGDWIYINSGSRTDHGEIQDNQGAHPGAREVPITSAILRVPADADGIVIPNDADSLESGGFIFADGIRNHFDMTVGPRRHLFGVENSGDRDDGEELNWLREGHHYGFPWRIGLNDTPQQFEDYDPSQDLLINPASSAAMIGLFVNDPSYPQAPEGVEFTDPIPNRGPDAAEFRGGDGQIYNAPTVDGVVGSFTPHKAPLGLVFDTAGVLAEPFTGDGFALGWNQASSDLLGPFDDPGEDLLHLDLEFDSVAGAYQMFVRRIADSFSMPIDAALVDTSLYVMEMRFFGSARLWRLAFPRKRDDPTSGVSTEATDEIPDNGRILSAYPNPFSDSITIRIATVGHRPVHVEMIDATGRLVFTDTYHLALGKHDIRIRTRTRTRARAFAPGVYLIRVTIGASTTNRVVTLVR